MTGDLAFYSLILGKEHMAPHWCWRCMLTKKQWTEGKDDIRVGDPWTVANMQEHLHKLETGELNKKKPAQQKGITKRMLVDCMDMRNIPVPPLHNNELFVNTPIKELLCWINHRIEKLPLKLIIGRSLKLCPFLSSQKGLRKYPKVSDSNDIKNRSEVRKRKRYR